MAKTGAKLGRPPMSLEKLPENWEELVRGGGRSGLSLQELRVALNVSNTGFESLMQSSELFNETIKHSLADSEAWWVQRGRQMACGEPGNATVWIFNMKNRFGWRDVRDIHHTIEVTKEQLEAEIQAMGVEPDELWASLH